MRAAPKKCIFVALIFFLWIALPAFSNGQVIPDSIKQQFEKLNDSSRVDYLNAIVEGFGGNNLDLSLELAKESNRIADSIKYKKGKAYALLNLASTYCDLGQQSKALEKSLEAESCFTQVNDKKGLLGCLKNIGAIYSYESNLKNSLFYFEKALQLAKELNDPGQMGYCYNNFGVVYAQTGQFELSLKNHELALQNFLRAGNIEGAAKSRLNMGILYRNKKEIEKSNENLKKAISVLLERNMKRALATAYCNLGLNCYDLGDKPGALSYQKKALEIAMETGDKQMIANAYYGMSSIYEKSGEYEFALKYYKLLEDLEDSVLNQQRSEQIAEMQAKYESDKKDNEIKQLWQEKEIRDLELKQQRLYLLIAIIFVASLIVFFVFFYKYQLFKEKQRRKIAVLETEHQERLRIAKDMHDELGSGLSKILIQTELLRKSRNETLSSDDAINKISLSVRELSERMSDLVWSLNPENSSLDNLIARMREFVSDFLEDSDMVLTTSFPDVEKLVLLSKEAMRNVFLAYKESINNAVKHSGANFLNVEVIWDDNFFQIFITDNGKGFNPENPERHGNGLHNLKNRIEDIGGEIIINSAIGSGSKIWFKIPTQKMLFHFE